MFFVVLPYDFLEPHRLHGRSIKVKGKGNKVKNLPFILYTLSFILSPMSSVLATLISVAIVSLVSLVGIFFAYVHESRIRNILFVFVSFAVGTLLGDMFFHLLPEVYNDTSRPLVVSLYILGGIFLFFCLEHFLRWHHYHSTPAEGHAAHPSAYINIAADALHNFVDGLIIGTSFLISLPLGFATTLTVLFHEIPQELGDFAILVNAGFSRTKALLFNLFSATFAILGGCLAIFIGSLFESFAPVLVGITAGGFIYLALADLMPQLHRNIQPARSALQFFTALCGIAIMLALTFFE